MDVPIRKRQDNITFLQMALNLVGIGVDYRTADLINETLIVLNKKKEKMNLLDSAKIQLEWEKKWDEFFKKLKKDEEKE